MSINPGQYNGDVVDSHEVGNNTVNVVDTNGSYQGEIVHSDESTSWTPPFDNAQDASDAADEKAG